MSDGATVDLVAHPSTGEVLGTPDELERLPAEVVAEALLALDERVKQLRETRKTLDAELARRLDLRGRDRLAVGDFELHRKARNESVWDADELELVLERLVEQGVLDPREVVGVITRPPRVSKSAAAKLVARVAARERRELEDCRTWKRSVSGVEVVRAIPLLPEHEQRRLSGAQTPQEGPE
jgi:hypothetical protein